MILARFPFPTTLVYKPILSFANHHYPYFFSSSKIEKSHIILGRMLRLVLAAALCLLAFQPSHLLGAPCDGPATTIAPMETTEKPDESPDQNNVSPNSHALRFAPYYDVTLDQAPSLLEIFKKTGQKDFTLAFALGGHGGCEPKWGGAHDLDDSRILGQIRDIQEQGGEVIIATGGAVGPYLEHICTSVDSLVGAYRKILKVVKTRHLDVDVEAPINNDVVTKALAKIQQERPDVTVSFTLPVQGDDYGVTNALGTDVLKVAKSNGVRVDIVNPMTMEYPTTKGDWGDSVIAAAGAVLGQMKEIWPEKSDAQLKKMLGVTPMIGRNFNGKMFTVAHAKKLVSWANENHIGLLAFWSSARDNGNCAGGGISPLCSSIAQSEFEFIRTFQGFKG